MKTNTYSLKKLAESAPSVAKSISNIASKINKTHVLIAIVACAISLTHSVSAQNSQPRKQSNQIASVDPEVDSWERKYEQGRRRFYQSELMRAAADFYVALERATNAPADQKEHRITVTLGALARCCDPFLSADNHSQSWFTMVKNWERSAENLSKSPMTYSGSAMESCYCKLRLSQGLILLGQASNAIPILEATIKELERSRPEADEITRFCQWFSKATHGIGDGPDAEKIKQLLDTAGKIHPVAKLPPPPSHPLTQAEAIEERRKMNAASSAALRRQQMMDEERARAAAQGAQNGLDRLFQ